jgi:hypothetical protein
VNSITTGAHITVDGLIETPFIKVFKGQIKKFRSLLPWSKKKSSQPLLISISR